MRVCEWNIVILSTKYYVLCTMNVFTAESGMLNAECNDVCDVTGGVEVSQPMDSGYGHG